MGVTKNYDDGPKPIKVKAKFLKNYDLFINIISFRSVKSRFTGKGRPLLGLWCIPMDPCFVDGQKATQKLHHIFFINSNKWLGY